MIFINNFHLYNRGFVKPLHDHIPFHSKFFFTQRIFLLFSQIHIVLKDIDVNTLTQ